jgi:hypothetical protein
MERDMSGEEPKPHTTQVFLTDSMSSFNLSMALKPPSSQGSSAHEQQKIGSDTPEYKLDNREEVTDERQSGSRTEAALETRWRHSRK